MNIKIARYMDVPGNFFLFAETVQPGVAQPYYHQVKINIS